MKEILLKVLNADMTSPFRRFKFETGKWYNCNDFDSDSNVDCSRGFYATNIEGLIYAYQKGKRVFEVEIDGKNVNFDQFKRRWENMKLGKELTTDQIKILAKACEPTCGYKLNEALFPFNPLTDTNQRHKVTKTDIENLRRWSSVWSSVENSVWETVGDSVGASVLSSVWSSVGSSVGDSVRASVMTSSSVRTSVRTSVMAYVGSLFPNVKKWKHIDHKEDEYPFQCLVDLWYHGFVPSFDIKAWKLHQGRNAIVVYKKIVLSEEMI